MWLWVCARKRGFLENQAESGTRRGETIRTVEEDEVKLREGKKRRRRRRRLEKKERKRE
jgi:hypothetical protein